MEKHGEEIHITTTEASGGVTRHGVRYVLLISLILAIGILSAIWIYGALSAASDPDAPARIEGWSSVTG